MRFTLLNKTVILIVHNNSVFAKSHSRKSKHPEILIHRVDYGLISLDFEDTFDNLNGLIKLGTPYETYTNVSFSLLTITMINCYLEPYHKSI